MPILILIRLAPLYGAARSSGRQTCLTGKAIRRNRCVHAPSAFKHGLSRHREGRVHFDSACATQSKFSLGVIPEPMTQRYPMRRTILLASLCLLVNAAQAALTPEQAEKNQPITPFRIVGNVYYVGASDVASYLIKTSGGLILLDGGFAETAPQIERNIARLGFRLSDSRRGLHVSAIAFGGPASHA